MAGWSEGSVLATSMGSNLRSASVQGLILPLCYWTHLTILEYILSVILVRRVKREEYNRIHT